MFDWMPVRGKRAREPEAGREKLPSIHVRALTQINSVILWQLSASEKRGGKPLTPSSQTWRNGGTARGRGITRMAVGESGLFPPCLDPAVWSSPLPTPASVCRTGCPEQGVGGGGAPLSTAAGHQLSGMAQTSCDDSSGLRGFSWKRQIKRKAGDMHGFRLLIFSPSNNVYCFLPIIKSTSQS